MLHSRLSHRALIATAGLAVLLGADAASAFRASGGLATFRAMEAMSYRLGSKRAIGYFQAVAGKCHLTLMIAEAVDPDVATPGSAARLRFAIAPGESASVASEEGQMVVTCGPGAESMDVQRAAARS